MDTTNFFSSFLGATLTGLTIPAVVWYLTGFRTRLQEEWSDNTNGMSGIFCQSPLQTKYNTYKHKYGVFAPLRLLLQRIILWAFRLQMGKSSVDYLRRLRVEKLAGKITG